jgi:hypothetical protein
MRRYLIVAHRTLCGEHLIEKVKECRAAGESEFHLLVPVQHPRDHQWSDGEVEHAARRVLDEGVARFADEGIDVTGEVGDANPVEAIAAVLRGRPFDEIILSTLPRGPSKWLKTDVLHRVERQFPLPVTHVMPSRQQA